MDSAAGIRDSALDLLTVLLTGQAPAVVGQDREQNQARDVRGARPREGRRGRTPALEVMGGGPPRGAPRRGRPLPQLPSISSLSHDGGCGCPVRLPLGLVILGSCSGEVLIRRWRFVQGTMRKYSGMVEDYETADAINEDVLNPILQDLVALLFFRYFKVK
ncbi:hypothetical protein ZWY2020_054168 [Hordeum vulgare]|nr:hypothetical protein ZWY2020_054168 [Hordeum vulgare]